MTNTTTGQVLSREEVAVWLNAWVCVHSGTDFKEEGNLLRFVCHCGTYLGISYGPSDNPRGADKREELAYFQHQADDLLTWMRTRVMNCVDPAASGIEVKQAVLDLLAVPVLDIGGFRD